MNVHFTDIQEFPSDGRKTTTLIVNDKEMMQCSIIEGKQKDHWKILIYGSNPTATEVINRFRNKLNGCHSCYGEHHAMHLAKELCCQILIEKIKYCKEKENKDVKNLE